MSKPVLSLLAPAAFAPAFDDLVKLYAQTHGCNPAVKYGPASGEAFDAIPNRLARDEPADVVLLPTAALDAEIRRGTVVSGSRVDIMRSSIGVCVRAGHPIPDIGSVNALRLALLQARSVAYSVAGSGVYVSGVLLTHLGIADQVLSKSLEVVGEPVGVAVARGDAELGFQQISELLPVAGIAFVGPLPDEVQHSTVISAGLASNGRAKNHARSLIEFLRSPVAALTLTRAGLNPITGLVS